MDWGDGSAPSDNDWSILYNGKIVGRVLYSPIAILLALDVDETAGVLPGFTLVNSNGNAADRDAAMKAFRRRWDDASMGDRLRRAGDRD